MTDEQLLDWQSQVANSIVSKLNQARRDTSVTRAIELLLGRIVVAGSSLRILRDHSAHDYTFDGAMILRGLYDAMLQLLYILANGKHRDERAQLYLDFYWIEKEKALALYDKSVTYLGQRMAQSPRRSTSEPAIKQRIQALRQKYAGKKGTTRDHWYEGNLRSLAVEVGLESEYELFQKHYSGAVHSSPYALHEGISFSGLQLEFFAWRFSFRVLHRFAVYSRVALDKIEMELIRGSKKNIFGDPSKH